MREARHRSKLDIYISCVLSQAPREVLTAGTSFTFALIHHRRSNWHQVSGWLRSTQTTHIYQKSYNILERPRTRGSISVDRSNWSIDRDRIDRLNGFEYRIVSKSIAIGSIDGFRDRDRLIDRIETIVEATIVPRFDPIDRIDDRDRNQSYFEKLWYLLWLAPLWYRFRSRNVVFRVGGPTNIPSQVSQFFRSISIDDRDQSIDWFRSRSSIRSIGSNPGTIVDSTIASIRSIDRDLEIDRLIRSWSI